MRTYYLRPEWFGPSDFTAHSSITPSRGTSFARKTGENTALRNTRRGPLTKEWASPRTSLLSLILHLILSRDGYSKGPGTGNLVNDRADATEKRGKRKIW